MENLAQLPYALDTFYFLVCGALVMWMAAGFSMLEAGLVRAKNTTEILTKNVALFAIACIMYLVCGYTIMYGGFMPDSLVIPSFGFAEIVNAEGVKEVTWGMIAGTADNTAAEVLAGGDDAPYYSGLSDFFFQVVFVATAMSIVSGAVAERMKLWAFLIFAVVMCGFIYPMQGSWSWGGGFLGETFGYSDYAGSGIVHLCGASAALAGVILLGARKGKYNAQGKPMAIPGANLPLATLGTFILWLGWFGFNGGSELAVASVDSANNVAMVFVNTNSAAAAGGVGALLLARLLFGKADLTMLLNGVLAGLVAITADPLSPTTGGALLIGLAGGVVVVLSILLLERLKIDDPVGAISVHGVVGILGVMLVVVSQSGADDGATILGQLSGIGIIFAWTFGVSLVVWLILKVTMGIRVSEEEEMQGVDISECGMEAYPEFVKQ